jgi:hypothetical protein
MIMRSLALFLLFSLASCSTPQLRSAEFPDGETVQLYYDVSDLPPQQSDDRTHGYPVRAGPRLNADQRQRLEAAVSYRPIEPNEAFAGCFIPHHFFKYFDSSGKETGSVSVCFCCGGARLSSDSPGSGSTEEIDYDEIQAIVTELGISTDLGC